MEYYEKPMASEGLISYRYKCRYGWIMIGATDHRDALSEARRSTDDKVVPENLQVYEGGKYVDIDLLENYHLLPEPVQAILLDFNDEADNLYSECKEVIQRLEKEGYTADYDLSGELFDLKKI